MLTLALAQITSTDDPATNLRIVEKYARDAAAQGAQLVVFPEATSQAFGTGRLDTTAEALDGAFATGVHTLARELGISIVVGMFSPADKQGKIQRIDNVALVAQPDRVSHYAKMHTYDAFDYQESKTVRPGERIHTFEVNGVCIGVAICYDIRFPELFRALARAGAEVIVVPTSWADGADKLRQWRLLTQARALDSTTIIAACDQALPPASADDAPTGIGYSTVVAADGQRLVEAGPDEELLVYTVDLEPVRKLRETLPVIQQQRDYSKK